MRINPDVRDCAPAPIAEAWSWVRDPESENLLNLCQAVPAHLPPQELLDYIGDALKNGEGATYTDIEGIAPLREALAANINQRYLCDISAQDVMITAGCNQAFCAVIDSLCAAGDNVVMPAPNYFNHAMWLSIRGVPIRNLPFDPEHPDPNAAVAESLIDERTRAIVLVTPNNPTGAVYSPDCMRSFLQLAAEKNIALIVDETYRDFIDDSVPPHLLFQEKNWQDHFVHLYSFSKVFALTGHRVGAIVAGKLMRQQLEKIQDCAIINAPHIGQMAAHYGLLHLDGWKREKARELIAKAGLIRNAFDRPELTYKLVTAGAYFAYVQHPFNSDARTVAKRLAEEFELVCLPGTYFGEGQEAYLRFAFANLDAGQFEPIVDRLIQSQQ